jgi:5S rRNA maturation endonuclease (ribonuclease M5)
MDLEMLKLMQHRVKPARFSDIIWGKLPKLCLPSCIVDKGSGQFTLDNYALNVLVALLSIHRNETIRRRIAPSIADATDDNALVKADRDTIMRITGMSKNLVTRGLSSLSEARYISLMGERDDYGQFAVPEYVLNNPNTGMPLVRRGDANLVFANNLHYFTVPECMFRRHPASKAKAYSFATMTPQEKRLYIALAWLAKQNSASEFETSAQRLRTLTGLSERGFKKALNGLESRRLVWNSSTAPTMRNMTIVPRNPITQELLGESRFERDPRNDPRNYYEQDAKGRSKNADFRMAPELAEDMFLKLLNERGETPQREGNGEFKFRCPFHNDSNPSCNFNPKLGCFHCFSAGCREKGTTHRLLTRLSGATGEEAIKYIADAMGKQVEFIEPDRDVVAIYDYDDKFGILKKQVLRLPNDECGNKRFTQRRPTKDGYIYTVKGVKPMLFNARVLQYADTVLITEGEKDAVAVTDLGMKGRSGIAVGTTSGGSESWDVSLTKELLSRRVVILPDDDESGTRYADAIEASLKADGIEYRRCSFNGTGAKDVSEYLEHHTVEDLVRLIGIDWIRMPDGRELHDPLAEPYMLNPNAFDFPDGEIAF